MSAFPTDVTAHWWILERSSGPDSAFGPFADVDAAETFSNEDPLADDQAAIDSLGDRVAEASIDALAAEGVTDVWIVGADMADVDRRERLIAAGRLSPGARSMSLADAIDQHNAANCLDPSDYDYIPQPAGVAVTLVDAVDLLPDAWADEIAADAAAQGATVSYTAAASGLRAEVIARIQRTFAERAGDADWEAMSDGQRLDEVFPDYNGIGSCDLLSELGIVTVYTSCT